MYLPPWPVGPNTLSTVLSVILPGCTNASMFLGSFDLWIQGITVYRKRSFRFELMREFYIKGEKRSYA